MKNVYQLFLAALLLFCTVACGDDDDSPRLPEATQNGKNTFGCLVDGKVFVPRGQAGFGIPPYECFYMNLTQSYNPVKGYFFKVSAEDYSNDQVISVRLGTTALALKEGEVYPLTTSHVEGRAYGDYWKSDNPQGQEEYDVSPPLTGEMRITRFDEQKRIVAGTFWFDAVNGAGEKVGVREGRFDMRF